MSTPSLLLRRVPAAMLQIVRAIATTYLLVLLGAVLVTAEEHPGIREVFRSQIIANSKLAVLRSPRANSIHDWEEKTGWHGGSQAGILLLLVQIDGALLDVAVQHWVEISKLKDTDAISRAKGDVERRFLRSGARTFLILSSPIDRRLTAAESWWGYTFESLKTNTKLHSFSGIDGGLVDGESCDTETKVQHDTGPFSCLVMLQDLVRGNDASFRVRVGGIRFWVQKDPDRRWIRSRHPAHVDFKFDAGEVPLLAMLSKQMPWKSLKSEYSDHLETIVQTAFGDAALIFLRDVAVNVVTGVIMRGFGSVVQRSIGR